MSTAAFLLTPLLVLAGVGALLTAYDDDAADRRRLIRIAVGCLVVAAALTAFGVVVDDPAPAPAPSAPPGT